MISAYLSRIKDSLFKIYIAVLGSRRVVILSPPGARGIISKIKTDFREKDSLYRSLRSLGKLSAKCAEGHYPIVILRGGMPLLQGMGVKGAGHISASRRGSGAGRELLFKKHGPLKGKKVLVIDDIIAEGETMVMTLDHLGKSTKEIDILAAIITSRGYFRLIRYLDAAKIDAKVYCFELTSDSHFLHELKDMGDRMYGRPGISPEDDVLRLIDENRAILAEK